MYICLWALAVKTSGARIVFVTVFEVQKFSSRSENTTMRRSCVHGPAEQQQASGHWRFLCALSVSTFLALFLFLIA